MTNTETIVNTLCDFIAYVDSFYNEKSGGFSFGIVQPFNPTAICPVDQGNDGKFHEKPKGDSL